MKDLLYWVVKSWVQIKDTLTKPWNKILREEEINNSTDEDNQTLAQLIQKLPIYEKRNECEVSEWMDSGEQFEITNISIVKMIIESAEENSNVDVSGETVSVMT